jgi:transcriptional regulator with XRE-family HTH domain
VKVYPTSERETLGERIRRLRKERNLSQSALANLVQVTFGWISQIEQDKANASPDVLNKIATALKVPIHALLQSEDDYMETISRIKLVEVLLETNQANEAEEIIDSLETHPDLSETDRLALKVQRAESLYKQKKYDDVLDLLTPFIQTLEISNHHDAYLLASIHNILGSATYEKRNFTEALYNYRKAYDYSKRFHSMDTLAARISYNVGITLRMKGIFDESIKYLEEAHQYFETNQDLKTLAFTLYEKGISYKNAKDFTNASKCFEESKAIFHTLKIKKMSVVLSYTVASEITLHQDPEQALVQLIECLDTAREENLRKREVLILTKIAHVLLHTERFDQAIQSLSAAHDIVQSERIERSVESAELHKKYAQYFTSRGEHEKVFEHALTAAEIFGKVGLTTDQLESLRLVGNSYTALGLRQGMPVVACAAKMNEGDFNNFTPM